MTELNLNLQNVYNQLCSSYQSIDTFRGQLLGRLPLATGVGIFLLYVTGENPLPAETKTFLPAIGLFGFVVTLGLFVYEIFGIRKCHELILAGQEMETQLGLNEQFLKRPHSILGQINEPFAAGVIYPAVLAAWAFLALAFVGHSVFPWAGAGLVFLVGFGLSIYYNVWLTKDAAKRSLETTDERILIERES